MGDGGAGEQFDPNCLDELDPPKNLGYPYYYFSQLPQPDRDPRTEAKKPIPFAHMSKGYHLKKINELTADLEAKMKLTSTPSDS